MSRQQPETPYYDEQIDYKRDLLERIIAINRAIEFGFDGVKQLSLLWSELKTDIQLPIYEQVDREAKALQKNYQDLEDEVMKHWPTTLSDGHKRQIIEARARPIIQQTVLNCKNIIINQLDTMGLLLRDARQVPVGSMKRLGSE